MIALLFCIVIFAAGLTIKNNNKKNKPTSTTKIACFRLTGIMQIFGL